MITQDEFLKMMRKEIEVCGSQLKFSQKYEFSPAYISDVLQRKRNPSDRLASVFGYKKVTAFQELRHDTQTRHVAGNP